MIECSDGYFIQIEARTKKFCSDQLNCVIFFIWYVKSDSVENSKIIQHIS